jgi:hypothetical protein
MGLGFLSRWILRVRERAFAKATLEAGEPGSLVGASKVRAEELMCRLDHPIPFIPIAPLLLPLAA